MTRVAVTQGALAVRYDNNELYLIGEGNPILGLNRVIGEVAMSGGLTDGAVKPLHPSLIEASSLESHAELVTPPHELTA